MDVAQTDVVEGLQLSPDARDVVEELQRLLDLHGKHVRNALGLVLNVQSLSIVPRAPTHLARNVHIGQEMHLYLDDAVPPACLASTALDIETEPARLVPLGPGLRGACEDLPDVVEETGVGGRIGPWRTPYRRLIDADHLVDVFNAQNVVVRAGPSVRPVQIARQSRVKHFVDQGALPGSRDACYAHEYSQRYGHIHVLQVVLARALYHQRLSVERSARRRHRDASGARKILSGQGRRIPLHLVYSAGSYHFAAVGAGAGTYVDDVVGRPDGLLVVLHHDEGIAQIAQVFQRSNEARVVALVEPDGRLVQNVEHAH